MGGQNWSPLEIAGIRWKKLGSAGEKLKDQGSAGKRCTTYRKTYRGKYKSPKTIILFTTFQHLQKSFLLPRIVARTIMFYTTFRCALNSNLCSPIIFMKTIKAIMFYTPNQHINLMRKSKTNTCQKQCKTLSFSTFWKPKMTK